VRAQATALACSLPKEQGQTLSRWSLGEIAARLVALEVVVRIAASTLSRWFAAEKLKPWRYHTWQHILDPPGVPGARPPGAHAVCPGQGVAAPGHLGGVPG